ncbi:protein delta homolog 2 isoform X2 [Alligator mississippiensis]|uniref:protein delta homolog 2 isoform X2 n=1 Tax=Alligator mississippiensis TaxID=8496 RepID=UPI0028777860|nr:protein delta homolog 2 isoform X2 [Alligator mississippiensis]
MTALPPAPTRPPDPPLPLPLPALVLLAVAAYLLGLLLLLALRQGLLGWELGPCPPLPRCCPLCDCACACQPPDCQSVNCICFEVKLR